MSASIITENIRLIGPLRLKDVLRLEVTFLFLDIFIFFKACKYNKRTRMTGLI